MSVSNRAVILLMLASAACPAAAARSSMEDGPLNSVEQAKTEIWTKEQTIYAGRGRGDLGPYVENTAKNYMSWPPTSAKPLVAGNLRQRSTATPTGSREKLTMDLVDFTLQDDTAIIYYRTHRTVRPDGTPADEFFDVTHTWVREGGGWKVLGGMARLEPEQK